MLSVRDQSSSAGDLLAAAEHAVGNGFRLAARSGHAAAVVAAALRRHHDVHAHLEDLANDRRVDRRIRQALSATR
jgi:hypothetical protein